MKIIHLNTTDLIGGAAKFAYNLSKIQRNSGDDATFFVGLKTSKDEKVNIINPVFHTIVKIPFLGKYLSKMKFLKNFGRLSKRILRKSDVIHLHNLHGNYFDFKSLNILRGYKGKIIITLHDMWLFTANEPHTNSSYWQYSDISNLNEEKKVIIDEKINILNQLDITYVLPSKWLNTQFEKSLLGKKKHTIINNGIDLKNFYNEDKKIVRKRLNLPLDKKIILFQAQGGKKNIWKGGGTWEKVVSDIGEEIENVVFIELGRTKSDIWVNDKYLAVAYTEDISVIRDYFNSADILCFPSKFENYSITLLEAMACGLPIVAFDVGGNSEIVSNNSNGFLVKKGDDDEFVALCKKLLLEDELLFKFSQNNIQKAIQDFSMVEKANDYYKLYEEDE
jgi:glycosyltransferase involved in cell wall biosynthesis